MHNRTDYELIQESGTAALADLFQRHYRCFTKVAWRILQSEEASLDAVQTAYLLAAGHLSQYRGDSSLKTWTTRIVINSSLMQLRQASSQRSFSEVNANLELAVDSSPSPEDAAWRGEIRNALTAAISRLPRRYREVLVLHLIGGLTVREAAEKLGLSLTAAKTRLYRARVRMQRHLSPVRRAVLSPD